MFLAPWKEHQIVTTREKAREMLGEAGFKRIRIHDLPHDPQNCYYVVRK